MPYNVIFFFWPSTWPWPGQLAAFCGAVVEAHTDDQTKAMWAATKHTYQLNQGKETTIDYVILKHHVNAL